MFIAYLIKTVLLWMKNTWGSIHKPYQTYRGLINEDLDQLLVLFTLIAAYFFLVSPIRLRTFHPFLLTVNAGKLFTASLCGYLVTVGVLYFTGKAVGGKPKHEALFLAWGYSLMPTLVWFLVTSVTYVLFPPPRTETVMGKTFSLLYLTFSISLFLWKGVLFYLTLRFAIKLDLARIILVSGVFFPFLGLYAYIMYGLGIFRVPFV